MDGTTQRLDAAESLQFRAARAEKLLDLLLKRHEGLSVLAMSEWLKKVEDKQQKDGARIGDLESYGVKSPVFEELKEKVTELSKRLDNAGRVQAQMQRTIDELRTKHEANTTQKKQTAQPRKAAQPQQHAAK